ncbi:hypothetical protein ACLQ3C_05360 [Gordonia sp. DT30]|uniref:hypothetical protein n=1 Tax=unclassified Gordonia (in: high G+C Gram-positive bacteria) TaxID=2657482 RepID=UPI003CF2F844
MIARGGVRACLMVVVPIVVVSASAGCGLLPDDGEDDHAISMTAAEASQTVMDNLNAVDPPADDVVRYDTPTGGVTRVGCADSFPSAMPTGPPWRYVVRRDHDNPDVARIDQWRAGARGLVAKGFDVDPLVDTDDPRNVTVSDSRGFTVGVFIHNYPASQLLRVSISSSSPCVRDPSGGDR